MIRRVALVGLLLVALNAGAGQRVVSLAPFLTDLMVELEVSDRLVGVLADPSLPTDLAAVPRVGSYHDLSLEAVVAQRPDLVLAWTSGSPAALLSRLESLGIEVRRYDPQALDDIARTVIDIGTLFGEEERAQLVALQYRGALAKLKRPLNEQSPGVFLQVWDDPLYTLSDTQLVGDVLRHCGARNVFGGLGLLAPQVGRESVIAADPEIILILADDQGPAQAWLGRWRRFTQLQAVRNNRLYLLDSDYLARATPDILEGVRRVCELVER